MGARLYTPYDCWNSQARVGKGFERALVHFGLLEGVVPLDREQDFDEDPPTGASAKHGVFYGPPPQSGRMLSANHERRWGMLAPNSDRVPQSILKMFEQSCTDVIAPSEWARSVIAPRTRLPVTVVPHGLTSDFFLEPKIWEATRQRYAQGGFLALHLSTSDRQRKGTVELVRAWAACVAERSIPEQAALMLVLDPQAEVTLLEGLRDCGMGIPKGVTVQKRLGGGRGAPPSTMASVYRTCNLVCQPSRGEGFGLVPLEARACGVPVLATDCTGHAEHLGGVGYEEGVVIVETGAMSPIDDLPGAKAPTLTMESVQKALRYAYRNWLDLSSAASSCSWKLANDWQWEKKLETFCNVLKES